jgi:hypothetical protein
MDSYEFLNRVILNTYKISSKNRLSIPEQTKKLFEVVERGICLISTNLELNTVDYSNKKELAEILLNSKLFSSQLKRIIPFLIIKGAHTTANDEFYGCLWLVYTIIYQAISLNSGEEVDNEWVSQLIQLEYIYKLTREIREPIDGRLELPAVQLLGLICSKSTLNSIDRSYLDKKLVDCLFDMVEFLRGKDDILEEHLIQLILVIHNQFTLLLPRKNNILIASSVYSPTIVLSALEAKHSTAKTFGEALIFFLNRSKDTLVQSATLKFISDIFNYRPTSNYFYTNDLYVLVDIIIRQLNDLCSNLDQVKLDYLNCLYSLLPNSQYSSYFYKCNEIETLLQHLSNIEVSEHYHGLCSSIQCQAQKLHKRLDNLKATKHKIQ